MAYKKGPYAIFKNGSLRCRIAPTVSNALVTKALVTPYFTASETIKEIILSASRSIQEEPASLLAGLFLNSTIITPKNHQNTRTIIRNSTIIKPQTHESNRTIIRSSTIINLKNHQSNRTIIRSSTIMKLKNRQSNRTIISNSTIINFKNYQKLVQSSENL